MPCIMNDVDGINVEWTEYGAGGDVMVLNGEDIAMKKGFARKYRNGVCDYWYNVIGAQHMRAVCYA